MMYYLLDDGSILDDSKPQKNYCINKNGEMQLFDENPIDMKHVEAKSENILDLARDYDLVEIKNYGSTKDNFLIQISIGENGEFINISDLNIIPKEEIIAIWKLSADGKTLTRHEVKR